MQLENIKCRNCGAEIDIETAVNGVVQCEYCRSKFTLPKEDITPAALKFLHDGESSLYICRFDDAYSFYKKAAELSPKEPEAYWGMAISQFKVQYVKDEVNDRLQPICHHISTDRISENSNYKQAVRLATAEQREEYERQAAEIDYIREEFYKLKQTGKDYDCFICVKVTDDATKQRTADYKHADDIYFDLKGKGYNPFFSERELGDVTGADYEARILYALYTSECMIVVCGKEEYLHTKWVKNEYTRFLRLVGDEQKESDSITIAFYGRPVEYLPGKNGKIQGIDLHSLNASEKITKFVEDHTPEARARRAQAEQAKKESEAAILKEIEKQREAQRELEERLKNIREAPAHVETKTSATTRSLLVRANQFLTGGEFDSATDYFNKVLDIDPESAEAWIGLMLSTSRNKSYKDLLNGKSSGQIQETLNDKHYKTAKQYSKDGSVKLVKEFEDYANEQYKNALKAEEEQRIRDMYNTSDNAWRKFLLEVSLTGDETVNRLNLNANKVKTIMGNKNLQQAYSYGDDKQKAHYDEFMARVRARVEELKAEELKNLEKKKEICAQEEKEYQEEYKINGKIKQREEVSFGGLYRIFVILCIVLLFGTFTGIFGYACSNNEPMLGISFFELDYSDVGTYMGSFLIFAVASGVGGAVLALLPTAILLVPINNSVNKNNAKYYRLRNKEKAFNTQKARVTESQNTIKVYERYLKNGASLAEVATNTDTNKIPAARAGEYSVILMSEGNDKIETIKIIRAYTGLGLVEAKAIVDKKEVIIKGVSKTWARDLVDALTAAGAATVIRKTGKSD
ncbi:MAG: ribosomal protein L7/L12 [Clostridiales bacterium]|nr:ribosomal protein L7/L12 [Clostridiales bacterium]